LIDGGRYRD